MIPKGLAVDWRCQLILEASRAASGDDDVAETDEASAVEIVQQSVDVDVMTMRSGQHLSTSSLALFLSEFRQCLEADKSRHRRRRSHTLSPL